MRSTRIMKVVIRRLKRKEDKFEEHVWEIEEESPIGFRTLKTALSIFICLVIYHLLQPYEIVGTSDAFLACVTAIICMKDNIEDSLKIGLFRLVGTFIGAVFGLLYLFANISFDSPYMDIFLISICIIVLISICNGIKCPDAIVICCIVFLVISLEQVSSAPALHCAKRFADTAIGLVIAVVINRFLFNPANMPDSDNHNSKNKDDDSL